MNSIEEIFENRHESDFFENLQQWMDSVPYCREGAEELLELISRWNVLEAYDKLLREYRCFLTDEEIAKLETDYKILFDIPLPPLLGEWTWISE